MYIVCYYPQANSTWNGWLLSFVHVELFLIISVHLPFLPSLYQSSDALQFSNLIFIVGFLISIFIEIDLTSSCYTCLLVNCIRFLFLLPKMRYWFFKPFMCFCTEGNAHRIKSLKSKNRELLPPSSNKVPFCHFLRPM